MIISKISLLVLIFVGVLLLVVGIIKKIQEPKLVVNKYIIDDSVFNNQDVGQIFSDMFTERDPWIISATTFDNKKQAEVNKFFISQA